MLSKVSSKGGGESTNIYITSTGNDSWYSQTYTFTQSCSKVTMRCHYYINGSGAQATHTIYARIKRGNTEIWSHTESSNYYAGAIDKTETITISDVAAGETFTFFYNAAGRYSETSQVASWYIDIEVLGQSGGSIERNLIPTEVEDLGKQTAATLFGRLWENERYGEITGTTNTAQTWNITLWNAVGFITMEYQGYVIKIPYYN